MKLSAVSTQLYDAYYSIAEFIELQNSGGWKKISPRTMLAILYRLGQLVKH